MIHIPDPPEGTAARAKGIPCGARLSWPGLPGAHRAKWIIVALLSFGAGSAVAVMCATRVADMTRADERALAVGLTAAAAIILWIISVASLRYILLSREVLFLEADSLRYLPSIKASRSSELLTWEGGDFWDLGALVGALLSLRRRPSVRVTASDLRDVALEGRGRYAHVVLSLGEDRIEMGRFLRDADREWLAGVLRRWLEAGRERTG